MTRSTIFGLPRIDGGASWFAGRLTGKVQVGDQSADISAMRRDGAPIFVAEVLLRHGFSDDRIRAHPASQWPLDDEECQSAVEAAHVRARCERNDFAARKAT